MTTTANTEIDAILSDYRTQRLVLARPNCRGCIYNMVGLPLGDARLTEIELRLSGELPRGVKVRDAIRACLVLDRHDRYQLRD